ncbi:MAG: dephospho-CoA kinase [Spirochaetae bacterium HGW-Spirochaetae-1]|jgi:dephospho-CoA kinase|nr:MAG: dephospho-CoA kinase [Spirochaetae bacterium HGW-Spirochaetae-1]
MRIGVTGIFASGKGTVCSMFQELGARVIDTDIIARNIVEPGTDGLAAIVSEFGDSWLHENGTLKRREFAMEIFKYEEKVRRLNSITHPLILKTVLEESESNHIYMINTPLLFETGFNEKMDKNIVVFADPIQVIDRGMKRDAITESEIRDRLSHQIPLKEKMKMADYIIDNSGSMENTKRQVVEIWNILNQITRE